jgi:hypothetical protein
MNKAVPHAPGTAGVPPATSERARRPRPQDARGIADMPLAIIARCGENQAPASIMSPAGMTGCYVYGNKVFPVTCGCHRQIAG